MYCSFPYRILSILSFSTILLSQSIQAQTPGTITTIGGGASDGDLAIHTNLNVPRGLSVDAAGNIYVADSVRHRVRKIMTDGSMVTIAGTGASGFDGDDGPATEAILNFPVSVFVDQAGVVYIADTNNHRIRSVGTDGIITTVAGDGFRDAFGLGRFEGDTGLATTASLGRPWDVFVDAAGVLYIADRENHRIRRVGTDGIITTFAGNGLIASDGDGGQATEAGMVFPSSIVMDGAGVIYIAETSSSRIRRVGTDGIITTFAGTGTLGSDGDGGAATEANLAEPVGVFLDTSGNLYIADAPNNKIRKVDTNGIITTFAGTDEVGFSGDGGTATEALLNAPGGVAGAADGTVFLSDSNNHRIRAVDPGGIIRSIAGNGNSVFAGDGGPATTANMLSPTSVSAAPDGRFYIADSENHRIRKIDTSGVITTFAGNGAFDYSGDGGPATEATMRTPSDVAVNAAGEVYIVDARNNRIRKVNTSGVITTVAGDGFIDSVGEGRYRGDNGPATLASLRGPRGIFLTENGEIYIADTENQRIRKIDTSGIITTVAGNGQAGFSGDDGQATLAKLDFPTGINVDGIGNIFIADTANHRIRKVNPDGIITTVAGDGFLNELNGGRFAGDGGQATLASLDFPTDVALDGGGILYITDTFNHRIRTVAVDGIMTTLAGDGFSDGTGSGRFTGDEDAATTASLNFPRGLTVDANRNVYIADTNNHRIRRVIGAGPVAPSLVNVTSFTGAEDLGIVILEWTIDQASAQHGYNIYRSDDLFGTFEKLNSNSIIGDITSFDYLDRSGLRAGETFHYELEIIDVAGGTARFGPVSIQVSTVTAFELFQNAPNPFNPNTLIRYALPQATRVSIRIYNMIGQEVVVLLDNVQKPAGFDAVTWDGLNNKGRRVSSGVYLYRITTGAGFDQTRRMVLLR